MDDTPLHVLESYALKLLSLRPRSMQEMRRKLSLYAGKKKIASSCIDEVLSKLTNENLINDEEFVQWWVKSRDEHSPRGERALIFELRQKGIKEEFAKRVLKDQGVLRKSDFEQAKELIEKKARLFAALPKEKRDKKITSYLARRGYSYDTVRRVIDGRQ